MFLSVLKFKRMGAVAQRRMEKEKCIHAYETRTTELKIVCIFPLLQMGYVSITTSA